MARILIAEDNPDISLLMSEALEEVGHKVRTAGDGDAAMQVLTSFRPSLVITDILMPKRGGLDLIREIRRTAPFLPIIAMSGGGKNGKLNFLRTAQQFPGVATLQKPAQPDEFLELVETTLRKTV